MRLVLILAAAVSGFLFLTLVFFQATRKTYPGFARWTAGVGFLTLGYLMFCLRGVIPDAVSIIVGNVAFPFGMVLHLDGISRFLSRKAMSRWWYAVPALDLVAVAFFYYLYDSATWRAMINSVAISAPHWPMVAIIFRHPAKHKSMFFPVIGSIIGLAGAVVLARPLMASFLPQWHLLMDSPFQIASLGVLIVLQLGENLSLIMLSTERVENELVEAQAELSMTVNRLQTALAENRLTEDLLRESEERYRTFFDTSRDCVFMTTVDGQFIDLNDVGLETLGYSRNQKEEMRRRRVSEFYAHPEEREAHAATVARIGFSKDYPVDLRKDDGTIIHALVTTVARKDSQGNIIGFQGTVRDITEQRKTEEEREALRDQLLHAQKMEAIGTLTGGIAHDFNNLLTIINGYTEMVLSQLKEDELLYADLQKVLETGHKGAEMVQRLLAFSKKSEISQRPLDVNQIIESSANLLERIIPKLIEIETDLESDLSAINGDAIQVEQVFMNLCLNAKEAMPDGGRLRITTQNVAVDEGFCRLHLGAKPGRYVIVEVSDTGRGISKETMDRIFDPFFTTKGWDFQKGTGLGLSVAKGIVEQHGGWISLTSVPGEGSTFEVYFPAIDDSPVVRKPESVSETVQGSETILLVDDEEYVRDLGKRILERAGYTVIMASNGREALEIYAKERTKIRLVILDLIMPQMGGAKCLEGLHKTSPQVQILVSTGHALTSEEHDSLKPYVKGFVNKPYHAKHLLEAVRETLEAG